MKNPVDFCPNKQNGMADCSASVVTITRGLHCGGALRVQRHRRLAMSKVTKWISIALIGLTTAWIGECVSDIIQDVVVANLID